MILRLFLSLFLGVGRWGYLSVMWWCGGLRRILALPIVEDGLRVRLAYQDACREILFVISCRLGMGPSLESRADHGMHIQCLCKFDRYGYLVF